MEETKRVDIPAVTGRLVIVGDLHYDHYELSLQEPFRRHRLDQINWTGVDALIVAGDISDRPRENWRRAFDYLSRYMPAKKTHVFPGNHDFYGFDLGGGATLKEIVEAAGANYVQQTEVRYGLTRLLCCTLWTDFNLTGDPGGAMDVSELYLMDYRRIRCTPMTGGARWIRAEDTVALHRIDRAWLEDCLSAPHFAGDQGRTVIVTHHGPHPATAGSNDDLTASFHSDLSDLIERHQPDYWFFGHSHRRLSARVGSTDIRNVSIGYPREDRFPGDKPLLDLCILDLPLGRLK
ncbi:MAG: hypothetical protein CFE32_05720 [Alphaproteobacteria bacterium PA3]|nr:MAG: hypothetical protein CFE32_05720 [Alphaproteobacteria bacterium PA3]